jgi:hypothetical protein
MAEKYEVNIQVKSNLDQTNKDVRALGTNISSTQTEAGKLGGALEQIGGGSVKDKISGLVKGIGGLNPAFSSASQGANTMILKMWEMVANPVGAVIAAIVIGVKFLYEAFQNTTAGSKELKQIWAGLAVSGEVLKSAIFGIGMAIIDFYKGVYKLITLDFKGAMESWSDAGKEVSKSYETIATVLEGTTLRNIMNIEKQQQANDKMRKRQEANESYANYLMLKSRETLTDETATISQKKTALEEISKVEIETGKVRMQIAGRDLALQKQRRDQYIKGTVDYAAENKKVIELRAAYFDAAAQTEGNEIKLNRQKKMLRRQESAEIKQAAADRKAALKEINDAEKDAITKRFEFEKLSYEERRKIVNEDKNLSAKDRKDFLDKINSEERKATEDHLKKIKELNDKYDADTKTALATTAQDKLDLEMQNKLDEIDLIAKTDAERQLLIDKWNAEYNRKQKELNNNELLNNQSKNLAIANDTKNSFQVRLDAIAAREKAEKDIVFKSKDEQLAYEKANADATKQIEKEKSAARQAYLTAGSNALKNAAALAGEATDTGKALAVAATTIDTYQSAVSSYKSLSGIPIVGPALGGIAAGVAVATGLMNVKRIMAIKVPGGKGGGSAAPSGGSVMGSAPKFNVVGASGVNQLAGALGNREQAPVQAYVVANNVTTAQSLDRNIIRSATLG